MGTKFVISVYCCLKIQSGVVMLSTLGITW